MPSSARVAVIEIRNVLGISEMEIRPGEITVIEGKNGSGKTSVLSAIRAAISGGHDATLVRNGTDVAEVVLVLEDGKRIEKRITREKSSSSVVDPEMGKVSKPQTYLDGLIDKLSLNPVDFLSAKSDKRVEILLESIPMKLSSIDIAEALSVCSGKHDLSRHALQVLQSVHKDIYDQRTGVNRSLKDKQAAVDEMKRALPEEALDGGAEETLRAARLAQADFITACDAQTAAGNQAAETLRNQHRQTFTTERDVLINERNAELERIRLEYQVKLDALGVTLNAALDSAAALQRQHQEALDKVRRERGEELSRAVATAEAAVTTFTRAETTRKHIAQMETSAQSLETSSEHFTAALDALDQMKAELLDKLPIKGMEVRDGDIFLDGVPFDRVNEARKVQVAIEVAQLRSGRLPLVIVDGLERLDHETFDAFIDEVKKRKIQLIAARVTDGALMVKAG